MQNSSNKRYKKSFQNLTSNSCSGGYELSQEQLQHHKDEILNNSLTVTDVLFDDGNFFEFSLPYIHTKNTHGTGCTLASAIAAFLGKGLSVVDSVREAQFFVNGAIRNSLSLGSGHGPLNHSFLIAPIECQHRYIRKTSYRDFVFIFLVCSSI